MKLFTPLLFVWFILLSGCTSQRGHIFVDYDKEQLFKQYKTFSWAKDNPMTSNSQRPVSPFVGKEIEVAIKDDMEAKGFTFTEDRKSADFAVSFTVGSRESVSVYRVPKSDYYGYWRWGTQYFQTYETRTIKYEEGSISIDIFDIKRSSPVWHGVIAGRVEKDKVRAESISKAVSTMLKNFPPKR